MMKRRYPFLNQLRRRSPLRTQVRDRKKRLLSRRKLLKRLKFLLMKLIKFNLRNRSKTNKNNNNKMMMRNSLNSVVAHRLAMKSVNVISVSRRNSRKNKNLSRHHSNAMYAKNNSILGMRCSLI